MGRWSQYDEDDCRLPEGMQRVGYDADTQIYTYQDSDGSYWEGAPGARYGGLRQVGAASAPSSATKKKEPDVRDLRHPASSQLTTFQIPSPTRNYRGKQEEDAVLPEDASISSAKQKDWRLFAPFLFLVCLSLLMVYHLLSAIPATDTHPESVHHPDSHSASPHACRQHEGVYTIRSGDTCSAIAQDYDMSVEELRSMNGGVKCEELWVGDELCVRLDD
ncbi:hypothetical protein MMC17_006418 [Xylographa soralifera]|nr:hypothetical protein [Xylographa soralifera]